MAEAQVPTQTLTSVRFLRRRPPYATGEVAGFPLTQAQTWANRGVCKILTDREAAEVRKTREDLHTARKEERAAERRDEQAALTEMIRAGQTITKATR